jgi:hypothetical protein
MTEEGLSPWEQYKQNLGNLRPWDMINPNSEWASEEKADKRYSICKVCPHFIKATKQCKKCGCFMAAKSKLEKALCPIGKW